MKNIVLAGFITFGGLFASQAQCKTTNSISENFDKWKDIDKCWKAESGEAMLYVKEGRIVFYSMMNPEENMYLATPKIEAGKYSFSFDASVNSGDASLEIYSISSVSDPKSFVSISKSSEITEGNKTFTVTLTKDSHLGIKVLLKGIHQAVYLDNVVLKQISK